MMFFNGILWIVLTLEECALNPVWDISISKEEVWFPEVAEEGIFWFSLINYETEKSY